MFSLCLTLTTERVFKTPGWAGCERSLIVPVYKTRFWIFYILRSKNGVTSPPVAPLSPAPHRRAISVYAVYTSALRCRTAKKSVPEQRRSRQQQQQQPSQVAAGERKVITTPRPLSWFAHDCQGHCRHRGSFTRVPRSSFKRLTNVRYIITYCNIIIIFYTIIIVIIIIVIIISHGDRVRLGGPYALIYYNNMK